MRPAQFLALAGLAFVAIIVCRDALFRDSLATNPEQASLVWQGHPDAVIALGMAAIGESARAHREVNDTVTGPVIAAARRAPLRIEPFLVAGVKAQTLGDEVSAGLLFEAAEQRDPRAVAPHLFLSAHYDKLGQGDRSLTELGRLLHLVPAAASELTSRVATSVHQAGGLAAIRALVAQNEGLRDDLMRAMSADSRNLGFVLSLRTPTSTRDWQPIMVQSLVTAGHFEPAFAMWAASNRVNSASPGRPLVFDPDFRLVLGRPFGWTLADGAAPGGLVERGETVGLHLLLYGRDPFTLASQTLILPAGIYVLSQKVERTEGNIGTLSWEVSCLNGMRKLARIGFARGQASGRFEVPGDCPAQSLQLLAATGELPETLDANLGTIDLKRVK